MDIKARLLKKASVPKTALALDDVNRDLIVSLISVGVYGAEARDEEIHNIIIFKLARLYAIFIKKNIFNFKS